MKPFVVLMIITGLVVQLSLAVAQERDSALVMKVIKHGLNDSKKYIVSPSKWNANKMLIAGGVAAATGAIVLWADQPVYNFANTQHSVNRDAFFRYVQPMGNTYPLIAMSGFALAGIIAKDNYTFETAMIAAESFAFTGVAVQVVKSISGRVRPNDAGTSNPHQFNGLFKGNSFYSGHTTSAFSVASVIAYRYKETVWVPVLSYSLAALGGMQRIYTNRHWSSDVFMGAAIGTATGIFLCKQWKESSIRFFPVAANGGAGVGMVIPIK